MEQYTQDGFERAIVHNGWLCTPEQLTLTAFLFEPSIFNTEGMERLCEVEARKKEMSQLPAELLASKMEEATERLKQIEAEMNALVEHWGEAASQCRLLAVAKDVQSFQYPASTGNVWVTNPDGAHILSESISNHAFAATLSVSEDSIHSYKSGHLSVWYVSYHVAVHANTKSHQQIIKSINKKRFVDQKKALQYAQGRKDALTKEYFSSLDPVIPIECREYFLLHGIEIPGYTYASRKDR